MHEFKSGQDTGKPETHRRKHSTDSSGHADDTHVTAHGHHRRPQIRGLGFFAWSVSARHIWHLVQTTFEFSLAVVILAAVFTTLLQFADTHLTTGEDAGVAMCYMVMVSLLLTSTDDWAPGRLELDSWTYAVVSVSCVWVLDALQRSAKKKKFMLSAHYVSFGPCRFACH